MVYLMRLLVISDIHEKMSYFEKALNMLEGGFEAIVVAGDITYFKPFEDAVEFLKRMREISGKRIYFVPGNCDPPSMLTWSLEEEGIFNIHQKLTDLNDYHLYGIGGGNISPFNTLIEWSETDFERLLPNKEPGICEKLIMVTHTPIKGMFDEVRGLNIGSASFLNFMESCGPLAWITGHVHEHKGVVRRGRTVVIHPGPLMKGNFGVLELIGEKVDVKLFRS